MNLDFTVFEDEVLWLWRLHYGRYDCTNYKTCYWYIHNYNVFHVERSYVEFKWLTLCDCRSYLRQRYIQKMIESIPPTLSHKVEETLIAIRKLINESEKICLM